MKISVNATLIIRILGIVAVLLVLFSIGGQYSRFFLGDDYLNGFIPLFFVDSELNIPTFFTMLLMLIITLLNGFIAAVNLKQRGEHTSKWVILSFGFLYMAYDEAFQVHEKLISPVRALMGDENLGVFYFAWVIPGIVLIFMLGLFFLRFLLHLHVKTRLRFLMAAMIYIGGAIGIELIGGAYAEIYGMSNVIYSVIVTIEESLEMAGLIIFIWALLKYFADNYKELRLNFDA